MQEDKPHLRTKGNEKKIAFSWQVEDKDDILSLFWWKVRRQGIQSVPSSKKG